VPLPGCHRGGTFHLIRHLSPSSVQLTLILRKRRALLTTVTEESAIAAAASTGLKKPYSPRMGLRNPGTVPPEKNG
jgi:hypothetical protein